MTNLSDQIQVGDTITFAGCYERRYWYKPWTWFRQRKLKEFRVMSIHDPL